MHGVEVLNRVERVETCKELGDREIVNILVVASGNPESAGTWSGVPCRVVTELRRLGHCVVCGDFSNVWWIKPWRVAYNRFLCRHFRVFKCKSFMATRFGIQLNSLWLKHLLRRRKDIDLVVAMSFCFNGKNLGKPLFLVHDWTIGYLRALFGDREIGPEDVDIDAPAFDAMRYAKKVVSLYPKSAEYMKSHIGECVSYICNPINVDTSADMGARIDAARESRHVLVVGGAVYRRNVETVLMAADRLGISDVVVDVVGCSDVSYKPVNATVRFHGYLDRAKPNDGQLYDSLFMSARCFVNVRKGWCGGSSVAEALYRGVPVVVSRNPEIECLYGECPAVSLVEPENVAALAERLRVILLKEDREYEAMCRAAHDLTANDTYAKFVGEIVGG